MRASSIPSRPASVCLTIALSLAAACGGAAAAVPAPVAAQPVAASWGDRGADALPAPGVYELDPPHTFIVWSAQHLVVGAVRGRFDKIAGTVVIAQDAAACTVDVTIDAPSVSTQNPVRDEDLRSPAFFDAARFPAITYRGRGIRRSATGWVMDGSLTIRGITKVVPIDFTFRGVAPAQSGKPQRVGFRGHADTRRAEFSMTRDLADEVGPNPVGFDVGIELDAEALAKAQ
jgi:polyisoprenoid-binding protein YceI